MFRNSLIEKDRNHLIHSATSWTNHEERGATILHAGRGVYLTDIEGREVLDGFSGLWCVNLGYGRQTIVNAAAEQMARLPYATGFFHFSSEPAIELAATLAENAPGDLDHVFFTSGGSDAVDSAVRFIRYYFNVTGRPSKKHCIALSRGYHGSSTIGAGLTGLPAFHANFDAPVDTQHHIDAPYPYRSEAAGAADLIAMSVRDLRAKVETIGSENVAAFFAEPVVGSGGVIVPPAGWLRAMRDTCRDLDILFVADEVITGFGRTGPQFACEHEEVVPDLMTLAKGLTSGYAPMGAVLMSGAIYRAIADGTPPDSVVGHGLTYSAHPVSAAVALECMRIYHEGGVLENGRRVGQYFEQKLSRLVEHPLVGDVRSKGLLAGVELVTSKRFKTRPDPALKIPSHVARLSYDNALIVRAFADSIIGLAPPLCCTIEEIDLLAQRLEKTLDDLLEIRDVRAAIS